MGIKQFLCFHDFEIDNINGKNYLLKCSKCCKILHKSVEKISDYDEIIHDSFSSINFIDYRFHDGERRWARFLGIGKEE